MYQKSTGSILFFQTKPLLAVFFSPKEIIKDTNKVLCQDIPHILLHTWKKKWETIQVFKHGDTLKCIREHPQRTVCPHETWYLLEGFFK